VKLSKSEFVTLLELNSSTLLELDNPTSLELERSSWLSSFEQAKKASDRANKGIERLNAAKVVLWVMVLPRNVVAKHLMMLRTLAGFPASTK
jgi:hypothetical protein